MVSAILYISLQLVNCSGLGLECHVLDLGLVVYGLGLECHALDLGLVVMALALNVMALTLALWLWPCGYGLVLGVCGLVNIPGSTQLCSN